MSQWRRFVRSRLVGLSIAATLLCREAPAARAQTGVLQVSVTIASQSGGAATGRRHVLLVSDNPPSRTPWRLVTALDGTGKLTLPPGTYTIESEQPLVAMGQALEWRQTVEVTAGGTTAVHLTANNAEVVEAPDVPVQAGGPARVDQWDLLIRWQDSVVAVWTPTTHASGVVIEPAGLIATTQRIVGTATQVEVQLTPALKVAARVLVSDQRRNVAVLWVDGAALGTRAPLPLGCGEPRPAIERGQYISAIGMPVRRQPTTTRGLLNRVDAATLGTWFEIPPDSAGGPAFAADGTLLGLTSIASAPDGDDTPVTSVVRLDSVCEALADARATMTGPAPPATPLPIEPATPVSEDDLRAAMKRRAGGMSPPKVTSSGFDVEFITPDLAYAGLQAFMDFGQWTRYVADRPAVLLVRVAPRQVESLWMKIARGAAMTQGVALPPIKQYEPGFARMRAKCGDRDLTPIHPFVVERRISDTAAIREGLYVFAADAIGPHCGRVALDIYSEKAPDKAEAVRVDEAILARVWQDLGPYRQGATAVR
jgi:S1-C subfamily serine protease